jgi:hypothetical protein
MDVMLRHRGRLVTAADIGTIRALIARHPGASRRQLSKRLCEAWSWRQANGALRDMVCRGLMLTLARAGHIELPAHRCRPPNNVIAHRRPAATPGVTIELDRTPVVARLDAVGPLVIRQVRRTGDERLCDELIAAHHYLGYTRPVGEHLKYVVWSACGRPLACLAWSSAPRHLAPRDRFIGWSPETRRRNLRYLAYNTRFLILPWVEVAHLASHVLGRIARSIARDWHGLYGHPVYYLETFVDPGRYRGTCYRAANWLWLGATTGRGKDAPTRRANRPIKEVLGYPLTPSFRARLEAA